MRGSECFGGVSWCSVGVHLSEWREIPSRAGTHLYMFQLPTTRDLGMRCCCQEAVLRWNLSPWSGSCEQWSRVQPRDGGVDRDRRDRSPAKPMTCSPCFSRCLRHEPCQDQTGGSFGLISSPSGTFRHPSTRAPTTASSRQTHHGHTPGNTSATTPIGPPRPQTTRHASLEGRWSAIRRRAASTTMPLPDLPAIAPPPAPQIEPGAAPTAGPPHHPSQPPMPLCVNNTALPK